MIRKMLGSLVILAVIAVAVLCLVLGKDTVSGIAEKALDAAKAELTEQIQEKLEEYKLKVIEVKPLVGKLNDEGGEYQFYCAALVQTDSKTMAEDCAKALKKVFGQADCMVQAGGEVKDDRLVHKSITYKQTDFSAGNYYTVYVYVPAVDNIIDLEKIQEKLEETFKK